MEKLELPLLKGKDQEKCIPIAVVVGVIIMIIVLSLTFVSLTFKNTYKLHYAVSSNIDYKVYLKENDYFKEKYLTKSSSAGLFISELIDYIDADFDYTFKSDVNIGLEYSYSVRADLTIKNSDGNVLYEVSDDLLKNKEFSELSNRTFSVNETIKVDYDKYNELASSFINTYGLSANANLVVGLYVDLSGKHADFDTKISDNAVVSISIPLNNKTTAFDAKYDLSNSTDKVLQYRSALISNPVLFGFSIVLALADLAGIAFVIYTVVINRDAKTLYAKKLDRILKDYERYISETIITERVEDMMKTRSLRIEVIKTFEGLVDIRDNLGKPILYHEERPGEEAVFYIITDRTGYIYVMRANDLKKERDKKLGRVSSTTKATKKK